MVKTAQKTQKTQTMTDKKQKILDTAIDLFVENGIHATSMQALAKAAGVATGSIYTYFDSKDTLVTEIFHAIVAESVAVVTENYDPSRSVRACFFYLLAQKIRYDIDNPHKFRFMGMCFYEPMIMQLVKDENSCENSPLAAVLERGQAENLIKNRALEDLFYQFFGGIASSLEWRLFNQQHISDSDIDDMITMAWDSIKINSN